MPNPKTTDKHYHYTAGGIHLGAQRRSDDGDGGELERFKASDDTIDRHGTIVEPDGIELDRYMRNPIFGWGHDVYGRYDGGAPPVEHILGATREAEVVSGDFLIDVELAEHETARTVKGMLDGKFLGATSIGFYPLETSMRTVSGGGEGGAGDQEVLVFDRIELLEVSLVPIPSNPNAVREARALIDALHLSLDPEDRETAALFPERGSSRPRPADNGDERGARLDHLLRRARLARTRLR